MPPYSMNLSPHAMYVLIFHQTDSHNKQWIQNTHVRRGYHPQTEPRICAITGTQSSIPSSFASVLKRLKLTKHCIHYKKEKKKKH